MTMAPSDKAQARFDDLIRVYVDASGAAAMVIAPDGLSAGIPDRFDWTQAYRGIWWCEDRGKLVQAMPTMPSGLDADEYERLILLAGERARLRLIDHPTLIDRARGAVARVEQRLRDMKANGDLHTMHVEYQDLRVHRKENGKGTKPFWSWLHERKKEMVRAVAGAAHAKTPPHRPRPERLDDIPKLSGSAGRRAVAKPRLSRRG